MSLDETPVASQALNRETQAIWDRNAAWWDRRVGEGNDFQRLGNYREIPPVLVARMRLS